MRVSMHSGKGYYKHQDHEKTKKECDHIDYALTKNNKIWTRAGQEDKINYTAAEGERAFYESRFSKTLEKQNAKYQKKGNYDRIRNMNDWMVAKQHSASEQILQVGNRKEFAPMDELFKMTVEYVNWKQKKYAGNYSVISVTGHVDEPDHADHVHIREVWFSHDDEGLPVPGIKAGLRELGVSLPDPNAPEGAKNYRKQTVDEECRAKWQEIVISHGYQIETEPDKTRKFGHMGGEAWKAYQDALAGLETREKQLEVQKKAFENEKEEFATYKTLKEADLKQQKTQLDDLKRDFDLELQPTREKTRKDALRAENNVTDTSVLLKSVKSDAEQAKLLLENAKLLDSAPAGLVEFAKTYTKTVNKRKKDAFGNLKTVLVDDKPVPEVHNCFDDYQAYNGHRVSLIKTTNELLADAEEMQKKRERELDDFQR